MEYETTIGIDGGGWHVEWYAESDKLVQRWYGTREQCEQRAQQPPDSGAWVPLESWRPDPTYEAGYAYACGYHD